jgi:hypothetical protein
LLGRLGNEPPRGHAGSCDPCAQRSARRLPGRWSTQVNDPARCCRGGRPAWPPHRPVLGGGRSAPDEAEHAAHLRIPERRWADWVAWGPCLAAAMTRRDARQLLPQPPVLAFELGHVGGEVAFGPAQLPVRDRLEGRVHPGVIDRVDGRNGGTNSPMRSSIAWSKTTSAPRPGGGSAGNAGRVVDVSMLCRWSGALIRYPKCYHRPRGLGWPSPARSGLWPRG